MFCRSATTQRAQNGLPILVYNNHIEITFNYKDGCRIIPFEEIQQAASSAMKKAAGSDMESYGGPYPESRRFSRKSAAFCLRFCICFIASY